MTEFEKEFYAYLGLLSVKFAKLEFNISAILGKLINSDEDLIVITLVENNSLNQNIELLKKINRIRKYQESSIENLIEEIGRVKNERNLFIHGLWGIPYESENDVKVNCEERKIRHSVDKDMKGNKVSQTWKLNKNQTYRLSYMKKRISTIDNILLAQEALIRKLETEEL